MKIYLASSYERREEMEANARRLKMDGHQITSVWITGLHESPEWNDEAIAVHDLDCIDSAFCVMCFTEPADSNRSRGGRHVEFGYALSQGKKIVVVGPRENVFYHLPDVEWFTDFEDARLVLLP